MSKSGTYTSCYTYVVLQVGKFYLTDRSVQEIYYCIPIHTEFINSCIHMVWKSGNWIYMSTYVWNIQVYNIHLIWMLKNHILNDCLNQLTVHAIIVCRFWILWSSVYTILPVVGWRTEMASTHPTTHPIVMLQWTNED